MIETIPQRGYRFIAPVVVEREPEVKNFTEVITVGRVEAAAACCAISPGHAEVHAGDLEVRGSQSSSQAAPVILGLCGLGRPCGWYSGLGDSSE